jgi:hypothetical protein|tara:strand:+ start:2214 stop:2366 length:153 start_codon:yes stop_codon:yes gene_type:complete
MEEEKNNDECKSCTKGLSGVQKSMVVLSIYILIAAIYGTYRLIEDILLLF